MRFGRHRSEFVKRITARLHFQRQLTNRVTSLVFLPVPPQFFITGREERRQTVLAIFGPLATLVRPV